MEQFKEKLRIQNIILFLLTLLDLAFFIWYRAGTAGKIWFPVPAGTGSFQDFWTGFIHGALVGFLPFMVVLMVRNMAVMEDDDKLKKLFIEETDERSQQILIYARSASTQTFLFAGLAAAIIAGFFSMSVSLTIVACVAANGLIAVGFKMYYSKKY